jgi:hypothetical protein
MATNYPGPYELRIFYTVNALTHTMRLNTTALANPTPGTPFADIDIDDDLLGSEDLETATDDLVLLLKVLLASSNSTIDYAELWKYEAESFESSFVSSYDLAVAGTSGSTYNPAGQAQFVFRTYEGGIMKVNVMESILGSGVKDTGTLVNSAAEAFKNSFITGANRWIGRDTSAPFSFIALYPGQSEALFKKRYR